MTPSAEVWDEVSAEPDLCTRLKCAHFDRCFLFRARRQAAEADVVVVNHHLLAADLSVRQAQDNWEEAAVLPPYKRLVLDEAHHLEDVAASHLGIQVDQPRRCAGCSARFERNGRGLAPTLAHELMGQDDLLSRASLDLLQQRLLPALGRRAPREPTRCSSGCHDRLDGRARRPAPAGRRLRDGSGLGRGPRPSSSTRRSARSARCARSVETIADRLAAGRGDRARGASCCRSCAA